MYRDQPRHYVGSEFHNFVEVAQRYWSVNVPAAGERVIFVDLMVQDLSVAIRSLTMANGIRRCEPARLVGILGADPEWEFAVWDFYDEANIVELARSYGVDDFVHLGRTAEELRRGETPHLTVAGVEVTIVPHDLPSDYVAFESVSTALRILRFPRDSEEMRALPESAAIIERTKHFADLWYSLMSQLRPMALIVAHVDYSSWGTGVNAAMKLNVPVIHMQSTGSLKAYGWFPEHASDGPFRAQMTRHIAEFFEQNVWANRQLLRRPAEVVASRVKSDNGGRPSWWRNGGSLTLVSAKERDAIRRTSGSRLKIDTDKPVVGVFAHAQSDALGTNVEVFDDFVDWLSATAEFAAQHPETTWLFLDHPSQFRYDQTDYFGTLAAEYADYAHMVFRPSLSLRKNSLWSLVDLAVTVRGSVSNEFPAFGVPALQAGWSEWSHLGFSQIPETRAEYFAKLTSDIETLLADAAILKPDAVERARLWQWLYRSGADVPTAIVPPLQLASGDPTFAAARFAMNNIESDTDQAMIAVRRMWIRKEPILTRLDFDADISAQLPPVVDSADMTIPDYPLQTRFDPVHPQMEGAVVLDSGHTHSLSQTDGLILGRAVLGRINATRALLTLAYRCDPAQRVHVSIEVQIDQRTDDWWRTYAPGPVQGDPPPVTRHIVVYCQHSPAAYIELSASDDEEQTVATIEFAVPGTQVSDAALMTFEFVGVIPSDLPDSEARDTLLSGVQINRILVTPKKESARVPRATATISRAGDDLVITREGLPDLVCEVPES